MSQEITHNLECDQCNMTCELSYIKGEENFELPIYCPFCGCDVEVEDQDFHDDIFLEDFGDDNDEYWDDRL